MTKKTKRPAVSFEDLAALQQVSRKPCGKQSFTLSQACAAAKVRRALTGTAWWVHICYDGCGREIFHLTHRAPNSKKGERFNQALSKRARKKARWKQNQRAYQVMSIGTWEGEGGALDPNDADA